MATVKRPTDKVETDVTPAPEQTTEPKKDLGYHTIKGGVKFPIVDRYWSKSKRCVVDVYEKVRHVLSRDPTTGEMGMQPGVKTYIKTYCLDAEIQRKAAHRFGVHIEIDLDKHLEILGATRPSESYDDREEI